MASIQEAFKEVLLSEADLPPPAVHQIHHHEFAGDFVDYIRKVENGVRKGFDSRTQKWYQIQDPGDGHTLIAYGHKVIRGENFSKGITEDQALKLLRHDLEIAQQRARKELASTYGIGIFEQLSPRAKEMLTDFVFNLGSLRSFPKFTRAVLTDDFPTILREYRRFSGGRELGDRNRQFYNRYLSDRLTVR